MMQRRIVYAAMLVAWSTGVLAQTSSAGKVARDYYLDKGSYLSQGMSSDRWRAQGAPRSGAAMPDMSPEARSDQIARWAEQAGQDKRRDTWREPPLKFSIAPPEMQKPNAVE